MTDTKSQRRLMHSDELWFFLHAVKAYRGSSGVAPLIFNLDYRWKRVVSFTPRPFYIRGHSHLYPLNRMLDGPLSPYQRLEKNKCMLPLAGTEPQMTQSAAQSQEALSHALRAEVRPDARLYTHAEYKCTTWWTLTRENRTNSIARFRRW